MRERRIRDVEAEDHLHQLKTLLDHSGISGLEPSEIADAIDEKIEGFPFHARLRHTMETVKVDCLVRAGEYVESGHFESALAEIRYVLEIEPGNKLAQKYHAEISALANRSLEHGSAVPPPPATRLINVQAVALVALVLGLGGYFLLV